MRRNTLLICLLLIAGTVSVNAQLPAPPMAAFEADAPKIGEPLPAITIYDDLGNPVNVRDLAPENYKVLILGCLT
jgi:hypothetical protein